MSRHSPSCAVIRGRSGGRGDWNPEELKSNLFQLEWPPHSGRLQNFPELDRAEWFIIPAARERILKGQTGFLNRLLEAIAQR